MKEIHVAKGIRSRDLILGLDSIPREYSMSDPIT